MQRGPDIVQVAAREKQSIETVARLFFEVGSALAIDRLVGQAMQIPPSLPRADGDQPHGRRHPADPSGDRGAGTARRRRKAAGLVGLERRAPELLQRTRREIDELLRKRPFDLSRLTLCANQLGELAKE